MIIGELLDFKSLPTWNGLMIERVLKSDMKRNKTSAPRWPIRSHL
jgi:hypothetical protein